MDIAWGRVLPVVVSIIILIAIAVLREYSKTLAAIAATMPINIPLGMWIIASGEDGDRALAQFTQALLVNIWPTILFLLVVYLAARAGWGLLAMLAAGYVSWGVGLAVVLIARQAMGV